MSNFRVTVRTTTGRFQGHGSAKNEHAAYVEAKWKYRRTALAIVVTEVRK